ncbi:hypothetical protein RRR72_001365 [Citrobacter freundii]|nr:hypothetical protein [Citrobacter freundii]
MEFELNAKSLAIIIPCAISVVGGAFYLGFAINSARIEHFKETIEEYKQSSQLDAPGLLSSLRQSATALILSASEKRAFDEAKIRVDEYASRIGVCEAKLNATESSLTNIKGNFARKEAQYLSSIDKLKKEIESYVKESVEIKINKGTAIELIPNRIMLGVSSINSNYAMININSESMMINIGEGKDILSDNRRCILWLTELDMRNNQGTFKLNCSFKND